jgi:hypothetical protein
MESQKMVFKLKNIEIIKDNWQDLMFTFLDGKSIKRQIKKY